MVTSSGVVKVLVSFYRTGEDSAFERHRSRVTFDLSKQSSIAAVKKHLTEFFGLKELILKFGMADFDLKPILLIKKYSVITLLRMSYKDFSP